MTDDAATAARLATEERRKIAFWGSFQMFDGLARDLLLRIDAIAQTRDWPAGTLIFQRGDAGDYMIAIAEGRVRLSIGSAQGRELTLRHAGPGDMLGELALFDAEPRSADAVADQPTRGRLLPRAAFDALAAEHPALTGSALRYLCARLRETTEQMEGIALYGLEARMARFLLFTLRQIHGADLPPDPRLALEVTQTELAAMLGASRPKVNRALVALREAGAIRREGEAMVCDPARLAALAEPAVD